MKVTYDEIDGKYGLYRFYVDCGRMGKLEGNFVAPIEAVDSLIMERAKVVFSDCLGSDSEFVIEMNNETLTLISDYTDFIMDYIIFMGRTEVGDVPINRTVLEYDTDGEAQYYIGGDNIWEPLDAGVNRLLDYMDQYVDWEDVKSET